MIDWFTVGAQVLNFVILIGLMKRFLYKPILHAIDAREERIAAELADAAKNMAAAKKEREEFQQKNDEFDQQRTSLLSKANDEVKAERQQLLEEARKASDALAATRKETLKREHRELAGEISRRTQDEVLSIARQALADLAGAGLEGRISSVFTRRLRELDGKSKSSFAAALSSTPEPAIVRSGFEASAEARGSIQKAINETFSADVPLRFETAPDLIGGIELSANGQKVAWSIAGYLTSLHDGVDELLKGKGESEAAHGSEDPEPVAGDP